MSQKLFIQRPSENFTQIPNELINDNRFNDFKKYGLYAKLLVINLYQHDTRVWSPTRKDEADRLGVSQATFNNRILPIAKKLGWVVISNEGSRGRNATWTITIPKFCQDVSPGETPGVSPGETLYNTIIYNINSSEISEKEPFDLKKQILSETSTRAITLARKALREESLELSEVKVLLASHVSLRYAHFSKTPMFAIRLHAYSNDELDAKEHVKITNLWVALREDYTGVAYSNSSKEFSKISGIVKNLLKKYSYSQIYWTLTKVVASNSEDTKFLTNGIHTLEFFIKKYADEYRGIRESGLRSKNSHDRILVERELEDREYAEQLEKSKQENQPESGRLLRLLKWDD
jgi:hypothetical protein